MAIPLAELAKVVYLRRTPQDGRVVTLLPYCDSEKGEWFLYLDVRPDEIGRIAGGEPVYGTYYAKRQARDTDFELPLSTLITQHLSFRSVLPRLAELENDVHQCAAVLGKYHLISSTRDSPALDAMVLVTSELEYLLTLLRSTYDVLQSIVKELARLLINMDGSRARVVPNTLPDSFADMVIYTGQELTADHIKQRRGIPLPLAEWYAFEAPFFVRLKALRDRIVHRGQSLPTVFHGARGLAVDPREPPWNAFQLIEHADCLDGRLASLRFIFVSFILHSLRATMRFAGVMRQSIQLPGAIGEDLRVFLRNPFGSHLTSLEAMVANPWEDPLERVGHIQKP